MRRTVRSRRHDPYDAIVGTCRHCGGRIELRVHTPHATNQNYMPTAVPPDMAQVVEGVKVSCAACGRWFTFKKLSTLFPDCRLPTDIVVMATVDADD